MTTRPAAGYFADAARTVGQQKQAFEDLNGFVAQLLGGSAEAEATIDGGSITPSTGVINVDTEDDAATDDLENIIPTNLPDGSLLTLRVTDASRVVTVKNNAGGTGQIAMADGADLELASTKQWLVLKRTGTSWEEVGRYYGDRLDLHRSHYGLREKLSAARTYYVRTDGDDDNDGLANNAGGAFLTIQQAVDVASALDNGGNAITIQIGDGTYTAGVSLKSFVGSGTVTIQGNNATPSNVIISTTNTHCFDGLGIVGNYTIADLKMETTTSGQCIQLNGGSTAVTVKNVDFGACAGKQMQCINNAILNVFGDYAVSGGAIAHLWALSGGIIDLTGRTITYSNAPNFSGRNFWAQNSGIIRCGTMTFTNGATATGTRYVVDTGGVINTGGGGASYIPGNSAGSATTPGVYA